MPFLQAPPSLPSKQSLLRFGRHRRIRNVPFARYSVEGHINTATFYHPIVATQSGETIIIDQVDRGCPTSVLYTPEGEKHLMRRRPIGDQVDMDLLRLWCLLGQYAKGVVRRMRI
jgi:hypothetical protein